MCLRVVVVLIYLCAIQGNCCEAQLVELSDSKKISLSPRITLFYSVDMRNKGLAAMNRVRDGTQLPVAQLRILVQEWVQDELELDDDARRRLKELAELLKKFESRAKWDYYCPSDEASTKAQASSQDLLDKFSTFKSDFPEIKWSRLEQVQLQFACMGIERTVRAKSPIQILRERLDISPEQKAAFKSIFKDELGDLLTYGPFLTELENLLDKSQKRYFREYMKPFMNGSIHPAFSLAHCRTIVQQKPVRAELNLCLTEPTLLAQNGHLAFRSQYLMSGSLSSVPRPWRRILDSVRSGDMSWLELTDDQNARLLALRTSRTREDGIRSKSHYYYGSEVFSELGPRPERGCTESEYRTWQSDFKRLSEKADMLLGGAIKEILLPNQVDALETALAISKVPEIGPIHVLSYLKETLRLTPIQEKDIKQLGQERLERLKEKFDVVDQRCREELSSEQLEWWSQNIGPTAARYPSLFLVL